MDAAERMQTATEKLKTRQEYVPEGEGYQELANVLRLLKLDRPKEAAERLEHWLNRNDYYWRMRA